MSEFPQNYEFLLVITALLFLCHLLQVFGHDGGEDEDKGRPSGGHQRSVHLVRIEYSSGRRSEQAHRYHLHEKGALPS